MIHLIAQFDMSIMTMCESTPSKWIILVYSTLLLMQIPTRDLTELSSSSKSKFFMAKRFGLKPDSTSTSWKLLVNTVCQYCYVITTGLWGNSFEKPPMRSKVDGLTCRVHSYMFLYTVFQPFLDFVLLKTSAEFFLLFISTSQ